MRSRSYDFCIWSFEEHNTTHSTFHTRNNCKFWNCSLVSPANQTVYLLYKLLSFCIIKVAKVNLNCFNNYYPKLISVKLKIKHIAKEDIWRYFIVIVLNVLFVSLVLFLLSNIWTQILTSVSSNAWNFFISFL